MFAQEKLVFFPRGKGKGKAPAPTAPGAMGYRDDIIWYNDEIEWDITIVKKIWNNDRI